MSSSGGLSVDVSSLTLFFKHIIKHCTNRTR